ncbi:MAG: hypothetical protein J1E16_06680 [Muribaculaceae bacterium]|nr:hypothetical protein [Muribaculaceae bacterium]
MAERKHFLYFRFDAVAVRSTTSKSGLNRIELKDTANLQNLSDRSNIF